MIRVKIESRAMTSVGYDKATQTLEIAFHPKDDKIAVWQYSPVPIEVYDRLVGGAESAGRIWAKEVKMNPAVIALRCEDEDDV